MAGRIRRYENFREDSARWWDFAFRESDIVISTPAKAGTTWLQMICALLIFQTADLPAPLGQLSPWLDTRFPAEDVYALLDGQSHRRFIKTHTPIAAIQPFPGVTYIAGARHPLDVAVSFYHQDDNVDRYRFLSHHRPAEPPRPSVQDWLTTWVRGQDDPQVHPNSMPGVLQHLRVAWRLRSHEQVVLMHYADLSDDLEGQMRKLAARLNIEVAEARWPRLVEAATFTRMQSRAETLVPPTVLFKSPAAFFRSGRSGEGQKALGEQGLAEYLARAGELAGPELLTWLHRP